MVGFLLKYATKTQNKNARRGSLTTRITSSEKPPVGRQCLALFVFNFCNHVRKFYSRAVLSCVCFQGGRR